MNNGYKISIVIPVYKHWSLCDDLLNGLFKYEHDSIDEILIVDDCSNDVDVYNGVEIWKNKLPITVIENEANLGFTLSANVGLEQVTQKFAERKIVFLISSDVRINGKFVKQTVDILSDPRRYFVGHRILSGNTGWNYFDGTIFEYLEGYFLAATSDGWRDLGYLDPNYAPYDFEDVDISTTAKKKGYKLMPLNNPLIYHVGGQSIGYSKEREEITNRNREYFRKKWIRD